MQLPLEVAAYSVLQHPLRVLAGFPVTLVLHRGLDRLPGRELGEEQE
jgi:hypothetical protein